MCELNSDNCFKMPRRHFLQTIGTTSVGFSLSSKGLVMREAFAEVEESKKSVPSIKGAFLFPPSESLKKEGYYSWPGSSFDAEKRQKQYLTEIKKIENDLGMDIFMNPNPLDEESSVKRFIGQIKKSKPDGLLLIPFKKSHYEYAVRIIGEVEIPTVVLSSLGILLVDHINQLHRKPGVYLISSLDNLDAVKNGLKMIKTVAWMKDSLLVNIDGSKTVETTVPNLGTRVRTIPHERFYEVYRKIQNTDKVKSLSQAYEDNAKKIVEPSTTDISDAAKAYYALKTIVNTEKADALMMNCLPGLRAPHKHVPPCMGFMSLRDEGIPAGCQSDLNATLTLMLIQQLFDKPGFQQNASMETEKNHYFGAHCTSPSKMNGFNEPGEPYILMNHCEAGWGCVPRVIFSEGQDVTMALYLAGENPQMLVYSGQIIECPPIPATGGCRTNIEMTINEVDDVCDVKGMHQIVFYGNYVKQLREFCQLYNIKVAV